MTQRGLGKIVPLRKHPQKEYICRTNGTETGPVSKSVPVMCFDIIPALRRNDPFLPPHRMSAGGCVLSNGRSIIHDEIHGNRDGCTWTRIGMLSALALWIALVPDIGRPSAALEGTGSATRFPGPARHCQMIDAFEQLEAQGAADGVGFHQP